MRRRRAHSAAVHAEMVPAPIESLEDVRTYEIGPLGAQAGNDRGNGGNDAIAMGQQPAQSDKRGDADGQSASDRCAQAHQNRSAECVRQASD
jgi:hypothetical protein